MENRKAIEAVEFLYYGEQEGNRSGRVSVLWRTGRLSKR